MYVLRKQRSSGIQLHTKSYQEARFPGRREMQLLRKQRSSRIRLHTKSYQDTCCAEIWQVQFLRLQQQAGRELSKKPFEKTCSWGGHSLTVHNGIAPYHSTVGLTFPQIGDLKHCRHLRKRALCIKNLYSAGIE